MYVFGSQDLTAALQGLGSLTVIAFFIEAMRRPKAGHTLVLNEFRINSDPQGEELIYIRGRAAGPLFWLLRLLGLKAESTLRVTRDEVRLERASLYGFSAPYMPLSRAGLADCFYNRGFAFLVLSLFFQILGISFFVFTFFTSDDYARQGEYLALRQILIGEILLGAFFYLLYFVSKRIVIRVSVRVNGWGGPIAIAFKPSVVEGATIDLAQALAATNLLNAQILTETPSREH